MSSASDRPEIKGQLQVPAILLIVVGVLNIFSSLYLVGSGALTLAAPDMISNMQTPEQKAQMEKAKQQGVNPDNIFAGVGVAYLAWGILGLVGSALMIFGGVKMMSLTSYGLVMTGTVLAMIPCTTPCCLLGLVPGIWGLVVLMKPEVKEAFR